MLKFIKTIIATALVPREKKYAVNVAFRNLLYAKDLDEFNVKLRVWEEEVEGVDVRVGTGEDVKYVSLAGYYEENWAPDRKMWARCDRKRLPIGQEHTTNRLERAFGVLKADLRLRNNWDITIEAAVVQVVQWAERKLVDAFTLAQRKELHIYDQDPSVQLEYIKAAAELNRTGCLAFKRSIDLLRKYESRMTIVQDGVKEIFGETVISEGETEVEYRVYNTIRNECNCTRWYQDSFPCRHILLVRREAKLPLFNTDLFAPYFYKERLDDLDDKSYNDASNSEVASKTEVLLNPLNDNCEPLDDDQGDEEFILDSREKFRIARDMVTELRDLFCHFGTQQFREYMWELEVIKRRVRRGQQMITSKARQLKYVTAEKESIDSSKTVIDIEEDDEYEEVCGDDEKLEFKMKIRKRGRPKYSGTGKLQFPKPKVPKVTTNVKMKKSSTVNVSDVTVNDLSRNYQGWTQICLAPSIPGQLGDNVVTMQDYASLSNKSFVTDSIVNWWLRMLDHQYKLLEGDQSFEVLVLSTDFYERLKCWDPSSGLPSQHLGFQNWTDHGRLWKGGARYVILPVCWSDHFYILAAVLDEIKPTLYVLESIGGPYAAVPPLGKIFCDYLQLIRGSPIDKYPQFQLVILDVPRQKRMSNNCGLFIMEFAERILNNPKGFEEQAEQNTLGKWFPVHVVDSKRDFLINQICQLASDQRMEGGEMVGQNLDLPLPKPNVVLSQVSNVLY